MNKEYEYSFKVKDIVPFEIDKYITPLMNVVAIEGKEDEVDKVYSNLKTIIDCNIIK